MGVRDMTLSGYSERVAMEICGHKTRSVFDRYNIISLDDQKAAAQRRTDALGSGGRFASLQGAKAPSVGW